MQLPTCSLLRYGTADFALAYALDDNRVVFAQVLDAVKQKVAGALQRNPTSVPQFVQYLNS